MELMKYIETQEYTQIVILSKLRKIGGIKLEQVAEALNISKSLLSMYETGRREVSNTQIMDYSNYLQNSLNLKNNLYDTLSILSKEHKVTSTIAKENPLDFLYTYLKYCCE